MIFAFIFIVILILIVIIRIINKPRRLLVPLNWMLSPKRKPVYTTGDIRRILPLSTLLEYKTKDILAFYNSIASKEDVNYLEKYKLNMDLTNWSTIPVYLFGHPHAHYKEFISLLGIKNLSDHGISSVIFSRMEPGKEITPHVAPYCGIIRYQLPLKIPKGAIDDLHLRVDGVDIGWEEGKSILFDGTFEHSAVNKTDEYRVVLLIDVYRKFNNRVKDKVNKVIVNGIGLAG